jgi:ABC-type sugar transport system permease subunit
MRYKERAMQVEGSEAGVRTRLPSLRVDRTLWQEVWKQRAYYVFISPFFILYAIFTAYPLAWAFLLSLSSWRGFGPMRWVGLDNYRAMISDIYIGQALANTLTFTAILVPINAFLALIFAVLLNTRDLHGKGIFRTIYFLPYITSTVIIAIVFQQLLDDTFGWLNGYLGLMNLPQPPWLRGEGWAKISIILLVSWHGVGYYSLIFLGGLQGIEPELYEAARIDGASGWDIFWRITVPLLRPIMFFVSILSTIRMLNMFAEPFMLTDKGGPGVDTLTLTLRLYDLGVANTRYGDAAALGFLIGILVIGISLLQLRLMRSWRD